MFGAASSVMSHRTSCSVQGERLIMPTSRKQRHNVGRRARVHREEDAVPGALFINLALQSTSKSLFRFQHVAKTARKRLLFAPPEERVDRSNRVLLPRTGASTRPCLTRPRGVLHWVTTTPATVLFKPLRKLPCRAWVVGPSIGSQHK